MKIEPSALQARKFIRCILPVTPGLSPRRCIETQPHPFFGYFGTAAGNDRTVISGSCVSDLDNKFFPAATRGLLHAALASHMASGFQYESKEH